MSTKKYLQHAIVFLIMAMSPILSNAQGNTLYGLQSSTLRHTLNPALTPEYNFYFGFPGLSSVQTGYQNRGFRLIDIIDDTDNLMDYLDPKNNFNLDLDYAPISFGFKAGKGFVSVDISNKTQVGVTLPRDFMNFLWHGNEPYIGKTADFSGMAIDLTSYFEYALGYSYQVNENLRVGAKFKILRGIANINTNSWNMDVYTHPDSYILDLNSDIQLNVSVPLDPEYDDEDPEQLKDLVDQDLPATDYLFGTKNKGMAFDLGGEYKLNDKITLAASVVDLFGKINWEDNTLCVDQDTTYTFEGADFTPFIVADGEDDPSGIWDEMLDSIAEAFVIYSREKSYSTKIGPRFYLSGTYDVTKWLDAGLLINGRSINDEMYMSYSAFGDFQLGRMVNLNTNFTLFGSGGANIGFGAVFNLGAFQLHFISDNVLGINYDPEKYIPWPASTQSMDFRFGINFVFGRNKNL